VRDTGGFNAVTRRVLHENIRSLKTDKCPFVNLPQPTPGRFGEGITAEDMKHMVWLKPVIVAEIAFLEWTSWSMLRHASFVRLRDDKDPKKVVRET